MATSMQPDLRLVREAVVREHVSAENRHDVDSTLKTFHHPRYDVVAFGSLFDGPESVRNLLADVMRGFPDFFAEIVRLYHSDDAVIAEVRMTGTQREPWAGITPRNRRMDVRLACIFAFDGERLLCETVYFDFATILRQLGAME